MEARIASGPEIVDSDWLESHLDDPELRIVDTRSSYDYGKGHVQNAVNIELFDIVRSWGGLPAMCIPQERFEGLMSSKGIGKDTTVVAYDNFGGLFSARLLWTLEHFGHKKVKVYDGSIKTWLDAGNSFSFTIPKVKTTRYRAGHDEGNLATKEWIIDHLKDKGVKYLDVRREGEYSGKMAFGKRGGHIPGAVHIHWLEAIDPRTAKFKKPDELRRMYEMSGLTPDKEVVVYCWMGLRASHGYMMLRLLGYPKVRTYDSSWSEWGDAEGCEVER
ncbi:MAG: sulfurtransferase [Methanomassiliicoccales archaeon]|nr:sulfurtransferase [Methanomassiliicoccales archaeon]MDD1755611.1 sulfurtransferase [Methanomassiliicoccales archaeon]